jgi:serine/threonine protein kinase
LWGDEILSTIDQVLFAIERESQGKIRVQGEVEIDLDAPRIGFFEGFCHENVIEMSGGMVVDDRGRVAAESLLGDVVGVLKYVKEPQRSEVIDISKYITLLRVPREDVPVLHRTDNCVVKLVEFESRGKIVVKEFELLHGDDSSGRRFRFINEVEILRDVLHPCVVSLIGFSFHTRYHPGQLALEFVPGGSLRNALDCVKSGNDPSFMTDTGLAIMICGLVAGMKHIHSRGVVHQNLTPSSILLDQFGFIRICGFGWSQFVENIRFLSRDYQPRTSNYSAPELFGVGEYCSSVDVFSFCLIAYELFAGSPVFAMIDDFDRMKAAIESSDRPAIPDRLHPVVKGILERGWSRDPKCRDSFDTIFSELSLIDFKLTASVDVSKIREFKGSFNL